MFCAHIAHRHTRLTLPSTGYIQARALSANFCVLIKVNEVSYNKENRNKMLLSQIILL